MPDSHSFCRQLLSIARSDAKDLRISTTGLSTTKPSLGGYVVEGPSKFYYYASSACCSWCAKAEAIDRMIDTAVDLLKDTRV